MEAPSKDLRRRERYWRHRDWSVRGGEAVETLYSIVVGEGARTVKWSLGGIEG